MIIACRLCQGSGMMRGVEEDGVLTEVDCPRCGGGGEEESGKCPPDCAGITKAQVRELLAMMLTLNLAANCKKCEREKECKSLPHGSLYLCSAVIEELRKVVEEA